MSDHDLIAAFLDEELSDQEIDGLLAQLECQQARSRALRQGMVNAAMRERFAVCVDISAQVRSAIDAELPPSQSASVVDFGQARLSRGKVLGWRVPATGFALAASMALAAVVILKPAQTATELAAGQAVAAQSPATPVLPVALGNAGRSETLRELVIAAPTQSRPMVAQWSNAPVGSATHMVSMPADARQRLNAYLINHARSGGGNALAGSLGYARVAASPQQRSDEPQR